MSKIATISDVTIGNTVIPSRNKRKEKALSILEQIRDLKNDIDDKGNSNLLGAFNSMVEYIKTLESKI